MTRLLTGRIRTRSEIHRSLVAYGIFGCAGQVLRGADDDAARARMLVLYERMAADDPRRRVLRRALSSLQDINDEKKGVTP